jgi:hypothetical protein
MLLIKELVESGALDLQEEGSHEFEAWRQETGKESELVGGWVGGCGGWDSGWVMVVTVMVVTVMVVAYLVDESLADEARRLGSENSVKTTSKGWKGGGKWRDGGRD